MATKNSVSCKQETDTTNYIYDKLIHAKSIPIFMHYEKGQCFDLKFVASGGPSSKSDNIWSIKIHWCIRKGKDLVKWLKESYDYNLL